MKFNKCKALHPDHLHGPIYSGRHLAGKQLCRKASEILEDQDYIGTKRLTSTKLNVEPAICPGCKNDRCYARVYWGEYCHEVEGVDSCPLLDAGDTCLSSLPKLFLSTRETWIYWRETSQGEPRWWTRASHQWEKSETSGTVQSREEKAQGGLINLY